MSKNLSSRVRDYGYYMSDEDLPKPILGFLLDSTLLILSCFAILYIWLVYRTKSPIISLITSLGITSLFGFALYLKKREAYRQNQEEKRRQISREYMLNHLHRLTRQEFEWQLIGALSGFKGLSDIEQHKNYIRGTYNDMPIAIGYYHAPPGGYESYRRLWAFYKSFRSKGFRQFLYVSSGSFEEGCENMLMESLEETIHLLDSNELLDLMEKQGMAPKRELLDHITDQTIRNKRRERLNRKNEVPASSKLKKFMTSSLLFLGLSWVFSSYFLFYFILSLLFAVLGLVVFILSKD